MLDTHIFKIRNDVVVIHTQQLIEVTPENFFSHTGVTVLIK